MHFHKVRLNGFTVRTEDLIVNFFRMLFITIEQFFIHLFTGTQTGERDLDVFRIT